MIAQRGQVGTNTIASTETRSWLLGTETEIPVPGAKKRERISVAGTRCVQSGAERVLLSPSGPNVIRTQSRWIGLSCELAVFSKAAAEIGGCQLTGNCQPTGNKTLKFLLAWSRAIPHVPAHSMTCEVN